MGDKKYLKLGWKPEGPPIILYQEDVNGKPILNERQIGIIKIRTKGNRSTLVVDSDNDYKFLRYNALKKNIKNNKLKKLVDRKIKRLDELKDGEIG